MNFIKPHNERINQGNSCCSPTISCAVWTGRLGLILLVISMFFKPSNSHFMINKCHWSGYIHLLPTFNVTCSCKLWQRKRNNFCMPSYSCNMFYIPQCLISDHNRHVSNNAKITLNKCSIVCTYVAQTFKTTSSQQCGSKTTRCLLHSSSLTAALHFLIYHASSTFNTKETGSALFC